MRHALLQAVHRDPLDETSWLVLADWLEEHDEPGPAEVIRLGRTLRRPPHEGARRAAEQRLQGLLAAGVRPCVPAVANSIGMGLALIPPGTFLMGSAPGEEGHRDEEAPRHQVEITRPFYLGIAPVTVRQFRGFTQASGYRTEAEERGGASLWTGGTWTQEAGCFWQSPGWPPGDDEPVLCLTWNDAVAFCSWLSQKEARVYRLPAEAEWEYACRAGTATPFHFGPGLGSTQANFNGNYPCGAAVGPYLGRACAVGSYPCNAFGLFDLHGNVWEWCADWHDGDFYRHGPARDPQGPGTGSFRVLRGGSWADHGRSCRAANRHRALPVSRYNNFGLRVACPY
jgi:uncharacterized protein (TIGR02996 family)